ncbi:MAG: DNA (cytosine-5-)-methyltransferase [Lachnospiraceae bacterium]|nr:DNA (cytosine-5-)-methyltransferase [Lachnospiraceae bacterium]
MYSVVSLFAGIGGICLGFKQAGFDVIWANEKDHSACLTYRHNFGSNYLVEGDIRNISEACIPHADILAAGFPCQSFSAAGAGRGFSDPRRTLFFEVIRVAKAIQPRVIFLENVENLIEHDNGRTFQTIYSSLVELGYIVRYQAMATHEYANIPQTRRRIFIVAFADLELSDRFRFPEPIPLTSRAMEWINLSERKPDIYYYTEDTPFDKYIRDTVTDRRYIYRVFNGAVRKLTNSKCPTLTASMSTPRNAAVLRDDFGVRRLTLRESLKFQGFPAEFYFPNTIKIHEAYKQIGNSVSLPVIRRIAEEIRTTF